MLTAAFPGRNSGFSLAEDTDALFVEKTLLHGDVLMWLMKTLLTLVCTNQRGAGQFYDALITKSEMEEAWANHAFAKVTA